MPAIKRVIKSIVTLSLILGLTTISFDSQKLSTQPATMLNSLSSAFHFNRVNAATILGGNQEDTLRYLYWLINGPPASGYPGSFSGPDKGLLGMIREITGPTALGLGLSNNGYTTCASIPSTGAVSMTEGSGTFTMNFKTPSKTIPTGYTGAGNTFSKHVTVQYNGVTFMNIEFECDTNVGWLRFFDNQSYATPSTARHIEVYWDTETSTNTRLDLYMYYEQGLASGDGNEYFTAKMQTETAGKFKIWITRAVDYTGTGSDQGFRAAMYGSTTDDIVNAYMRIASNITDTTTDFTDNGNITAVGDAQCIDFNNGGVASDAAGSCGSLALTSAGAPLVDNAGDVSISWVASTMKGKMSTITDP